MKMENLARRRRIAVDHILIVINHRGMESPDRDELRSAVENCDDYYLGFLHGIAGFYENNCGEFDAKLKQAARHDMLQVINMIVQTGGEVIVV